MITFGQTIRHLRTSRHLTQRALANEVGINFTYLSKIENNRLEPGQSPKKDTIARLAQALDTDTDELLLLARKIPDSITQQIMERPSLFRKIACLDDRTVDQLVQGLDDHKKGEALVALNQSPCILHEVLDSLPHHIAVVDQDGVIIMVNQAWREFAVNNGMDADLCREGTDYFSVCDAGTGMGPDDAATVTTAIREMLAGTRETFEFEYPCRTPTENRTSLLRVTRFLQGDACRVVVSHDIVSARQFDGIDLKGKLAEQN